MSSDAHLRKDHGTLPESGPYIDWGPDLPARYSGGRARLLVANPWTLFVTWESASAPERWGLELERADGSSLEVAELAGGTSDAWIRVPAKTRGVVHLLRDGVRVAALPFATPPDAPSNNLDERWGLIDATGEVHEAQAVDGRALADQHGVVAVKGPGYSSSGVAKKA